MAYKLELCTGAAIKEDAVGKQPITAHMMMCLISAQAVHTHTHNCAQTPYAIYTDQTKRLVL
jgi:hypothetical protein